MTNLAKNRKEAAYLVSMLMIMSLLAGCAPLTSERLASPPPRVILPVQPAIVASVEQENLPPISANQTASDTIKEIPDSQDDKNPLQSSPQEATLFAAAPPSALALGPLAVAGVWQVSTPNASCRIATPQTKFGRGFRAAPLHCPPEIAQITSWGIDSRHLQFYDKNGKTIASLYSQTQGHFYGKTLLGTPLHLDR